MIFLISNQFIWKPKQEALLEKQKKEALEKADQQDYAPQETPIPIQNEQNSIYNSLVFNDSIAIVYDLILENETIKITFSNLGGNISSVELKEYRAQDRVSNIELVPENQKLANLRIFSKNKQMYDLDEAVFNYDIIGENGIIFTVNTTSGIIRKEYTLQEEYTLDMNLSVENFENIDRYEIGLEGGIADTEEFIKYKHQDYKVYTQVDSELLKRALKSLRTKDQIVELKSTINNDPAKKQKKLKTYETSGKIDWASLRSKFFNLSIIPDEMIRINKMSYFNNEGQPALYLNARLDRETFEHQYQFYFGPSLYNNMAQFNNGIEKIVEMGPGFLQWLSKLFHKLFNFLHSFIPSWGVCLLIFAILIKLLLYPLTHKSFEASSKMQAVMPKTREIQAKYKHDPLLMHKEMKKMHKEEGVNQFGGCLPMLLQMPIFFALYPILRYSIDLRQAGFLWIKDLSAPDPYLIMPILMGVFMFLQSYLMQPKNSKTAEMDEKQQAQMQSQKMITYIMPVMMFFMFKNFPSGLVIYWTVFNVFSIVQMLFIRNKFEHLKPAKG